jgi:hypothetical protein
VSEDDLAQLAERLYTAVDAVADDLSPFIWDQLKEPWVALGLALGRERREQP